jgi:hypothetical protein
MHQAAGIVGDQDLGASVGRGFQLVFSHGH